MQRLPAYPLRNSLGLFWKLTPNSVDKFDDLGKKFLTQFLATRVRKKPSRHLLTLRQRDDESLKEFIVRFNLEKMDVENPPKVGGRGTEKEEV